MKRHVRGLLFRDYVRMIRSRGDVRWGAHLSAEDLAFIGQRIDPQGWYPMESFERYGLAILGELAGGEMGSVRIWGRLQFESAHAHYPSLIAEGDPRETLMRFQVLRRTFFDFDAIDLLTVHDKEATIALAYGMAPLAEEAACHQTLGFFEQLVHMAGAASAEGRFSKTSWSGAAATLIELAWS